MSQFPTPDKPLPSVPQSPMAAPSSSPGAKSKDENNVTLLPADSSAQLYMTTTSDTTQRDYALLELLDSERRYASDLILIREYQIPLASGRLSSISSILAAPDSEDAIHCYPGLATSQVTHAVCPGASEIASRPRPLTTVSEASALSLGSIFTLRPMKTKDINIVFGNIEELAAFSERFLYELESALGEFIEGNEGQDYIGRFFLDFIPEMEPLYSTYVMNQPHALEHYHLLSQTFQFDVYHPRSQILAHKSSKAWDLPSLLIKPVQRLLHYPPLLAALIAATPDSHADKANLIEAHAQMGELARGLDARWRQQKVVQDVLTGATHGNTQHASHEATKATKKLKRVRKVGLAASMNLGRIMKPRLAMAKTKGGPEMDAEAAAVRAMGERLIRKYEPFMAQLVRGMVDWVDSMHNVFLALAEWAQSFGRVMWMDPGEARSDVFQALLALIGQSLVASDGLRTKIRENVLRVVDSFQGTMEAPVRLLDRMQTLEALHYGPLKVNMAALESYIALRAQLLAELPVYLKLLDRGMAGCVLRFSRIQRRFYSQVHDRWTKLGNYLQAKRWANQGADHETVQVGSRQYGAAEVQVPTSLGIALRSGERLTAVPEPFTEFGSEEDTGRRIQAPPSVSLASLLISVEQSRSQRLPARTICGPSTPSTPYYVTQLIETFNALKLRSTPFAPFAPFPGPPTLVHPRMDIVPASSPPTTSRSSRTHPDVDNGTTLSSNNVGEYSVSDTVRRDGNRQTSSRRRNSQSERWPTDETSDTLQLQEEPGVVQSPIPKRDVRFDESRLLSLPLRLPVMEEDSEEAASELDDVCCADNMGIPNDDEGDVPPQKRVVRFIEDPSSVDSESDHVSEFAGTTLTAYVDQVPSGPATSAMLDTRLDCLPYQAPSFINRQLEVVAYSQPQSVAVNASSGTRLVRECSDRWTAATPVSRMVVPHSSHERRFGDVAATREDMRLKPPRANLPLSDSECSGYATDIDSEDSGIGFYRDIVGVKEF